MASVPWAGPRRSVEALAERYGRDVVVAWCLDLLARRAVDGHVIFALGGPPAKWAVYGGRPVSDYWLRVWAMRGLLWLWDDAAAEAVVAGLDDEAWRVREMGAKVVARHRVDSGLPGVLELRQDPVARVRQAAARAVMRLTSDAPEPVNRSGRDAR